jgi:hypothetical protein
MRTTIASLLSWFSTLPTARRTIVILFALSTGALVLSWFVRPTNRISQRGFPETSSFVPIPPGNQPDAELKAQWERMKQSHKAPPAEREAIGPVTDELGYATPMIAHAAELAVATKEFAHSRSTLEQILERHHGYAAKLRMVGQPSASMLTATLRVPSTEFTAAVTDLKTLGNVEGEEQTADEITQQRENPQFAGGSTAASKRHCGDCAAGGGARFSRASGDLCPSTSLPAGRGEAAREESSGRIPKCRDGGPI